jgi:hypothetical protein
LANVKTPLAVWPAAACTLPSTPSKTMSCSIIPAFLSVTVSLPAPGSESCAGANLKSDATTSTAPFAVWTGAAAAPLAAGAAGPPVISCADGSFSAGPATSHQNMPSASRKIVVSPPSSVQ